MALRNYPQNTTIEQNSLTAYFLSVYFYLQYFLMPGKRIKCNT